MFTMFTNNICGTLEHSSRGKKCTGSCSPPDFDSGKAARLQNAIKPDCSLQVF